MLLVASELYPLAKTGGLADYVAAHGKALARAGCDVRVLLPGYPEALDRLGGRVARFDLSTFPGLEGVSLVQGEVPGSSLRAWLVDCPPLFERPGSLYQDEAGADWPDNDRRFATFARAAMAVLGSDGPFVWRPEIVHMNDWQTGPLAAMLAQEPPGRPKTVFTIHNLAFRGLFGSEALAMLNLPDSLFTPEGLEFWGHVSFLKAGIRYADRVTTVSETYAREILTAPFGCGFDGVLRARTDGVVGIRNGIDEEEWGPVADPHLPARYDLHDLRGKAVCKEAVQAMFGLPPDPEAPLVAYLCRLADQKMADVVLAALPELSARGVQLVVMGRGDPAVEAGFRAAAGAFAGRVGVHVGYDEPRAHLLLAGADMLLAPARFEPCGLTQMYAMRYGTIPVASRVGGLAETVTDLPPGSPSVADATGFLFDGAAVADLTAAVDRAVAHYRQPFPWRRLVTNAMRGDFSWTVSARRYLEVYDALAPTPVFDSRSRARPSRSESRVLPLRGSGGRRAAAATFAAETGFAPKTHADPETPSLEGSVEMATSQISAEDIRRRAYELWERNGRADGGHLDHWLQAEQQLMKERGLSSAAPASAVPGATPGATLGAMGGAGGATPAKPARSPRPSRSAKQAAPAAPSEQPVPGGAMPERQRSARGGGTARNR